ncbi:peptidoglycan DD-metalloendopeptidase family protein [soil metagenome]
MFIKSNLIFVQVQNGAMKKIIFLLQIVALSFTGFSQSKEEIQRQRQQLRAEIEATQRILNETKKSTKENLGQLNLISRQINLQENVIENISGELHLIENDIVKSQREINKLTRVLDTLKQEYAKSMVYAYKNRNSYDFLNFIFAASNFNDAVKRITYLKSYRNYREMQGENILRTQQLLHMRIDELSGKKTQKNTVLQEKGREMTQMEVQQREKENIIQKLKGRQRELSSQLVNKRKQDIKLRNMIDGMIRKEIELARRRAEAQRIERERAAAANSNNTSTTTTTTTTSKPRTQRKTESVLVSSEADRLLDANFERNKGSLPWPADGFVLFHFGSNTYPDGNRYNNPGVSVGTQIGATVKAVFDGEVTLINTIDENHVVFIKHGQYFTVYSNLSSASVQKGQQIKTGQVIGKASANDDGQGEVDLMIMKETNNVNPEQWLRRK